MINVGIIGATGYAGVELLRLLLHHPQATVSALSSVSFEGKKISEVYPNLTGICGHTLVDEDTVIEKSDVVFASLPHGLSEPLAKKCKMKGSIFIDLGADFRLEDENKFKKWYGLDYKEPKLHRKPFTAYQSFTGKKQRKQKLSAIQAVIQPVSVLLSPPHSSMD